MELRDLVGFTMRSARSHRLRSALTALGIGIGVTAVVLLTSIGEGLHRYVLAQFTQFGTNIIAVNPGRSTLRRGDRGFRQRAPAHHRRRGGTQARAFRDQHRARGAGHRIGGGGRARAQDQHGVGPEMPTAFSFRVALGKFLPADDPRAPRPLAVLGSTVRRELYGERNPLGDMIRVGGERYRVVGVI